MINQAYIDRTFPRSPGSPASWCCCSSRALATYGHTVILSKINNAILANQRRLFLKLMSESLRFTERHSSEFLTRLTSGAKSITDV